MKKSFILGIFLLSVFQSVAQDVYPLWEKGKIPFYKENTLQEYEKETYGTRCIYDITFPTITVFEAEGKKKTENR